MKKIKYRDWIAGIGLLMAFWAWTALIQTADVQPVGQNGTMIGLAALNLRFHAWTGVHMWLYLLTDWLGLVPILMCLFFGGIGLCQLIRQRSLGKVDRDLLILGFYYLIVILFYLLFAELAIHYRPILIEGRMEASYPSSTTLLVVCVMPTVTAQANRRLKSAARKRMIRMVCVGFTAAMAVARLVCGVHWLMDIVGALLLGMGLFRLYKAVI